MKGVWTSWQFFDNKSQLSTRTIRYRVAQADGLDPEATFHNNTRRNRTMNLFGTHHAKSTFVKRLLTMFLLLGLSLGFVPSAPSHAAGVFNVDRTNDLRDTNPGDGRCDGVPDIFSVGDECSLRAAIMEANALNDNHLIVVPAGTYPLTAAKASDKDEAAGDLDIRSSMTIVGAGADKTIIDAQRAGRVFETSGSTADVRLNQLTIQGGETEDAVGGGGIFTAAPNTNAHSVVY